MVYGHYACRKEINQGILATATGVPSPPLLSSCFKNRCSHVESLATTECWASRPKSRSTSSAWQKRGESMAHLMPHSILTAARATCQTGSSQPDQIGFSKLLNIVFFPESNKVRTEKGLSIFIAQNLKYSPLTHVGICFFQNLKLAWVVEGLILV